MLQLIATEGERTRVFIARDFPCVIGRSRNAHLQLESAGVWETHATICIREGRYYVQPEGESLLRVNDERSSGQELRMGDQLSIGAASVSLMLSPAAQRGLKGRELLIWMIVGAVTILQVFLLLSIP